MTECDIVPHSGSPKCVLGILLILYLVLTIALWRGRYAYATVLTRKHSSVWHGLERHRVVGAGW